jgi:arginyl-tRNA synthetase
MNLLKPIVSEIDDLLRESNLNETIDLRITNLENYDYQINNFVKYQNHPDIKIIKEKVSKALNSSELVKEFKFEKNLFINLKINAELIVTDLENVNKRILSTNKEEVIIDYGGPNIGKPLHVGHLRPLNIGRSIYNINKVVGNKVYSDIHLGDWGMPVAQIITYCELEDLKLDDISIEMLEEIYPNASVKYKTEKKFKEKAQETNKLLTSGDKVTLKNWGRLVI